MKPPDSSRPAAEQGKLPIGLPGNAKKRAGRIRAAIRANRETLRRLAK